MFSVCRKCTKLIAVSTVLNNIWTRSFFMKRNSIKNSALIESYLRRAFSSIPASTTGEDVLNQGEIDYESIAGGDKELEYKLKVIALETEVMRQEGKLVPPNSYLTHSHWKELLNLQSRTARGKYLEYLFKISKKKENKEVKKQEKRLQFEEWKDTRDKENENIKETIEDFALQYDLKHNNIFLRFYDTTINQMYNNRLIQAIMFGQKLVIDCGYHTDMTRRENYNCAKQLMLLFAENRAHDQPFDLHLCNADPESVLLQQLNKYIPNMYEKSFPLNFHQESYLDMFPKDQLVYLTPHCREEVTTFDHNTTYIVGALVDKVNNQPLSLAKAKKEGLRMGKLPLDRYLQWSSGSGKSLTLNQVVSILNDIKATGNWEHALQHVPKRKIVDFSVDRNISAATDNLRYDKPRRERKWVPSANVNYDGLSYNNGNKSKSKDRIIKVRTIMHDYD